MTMSTPVAPMAVVAGVDGSADGIRAVRWAARAAARTGVPLRLVHATPALPPSPFPVSSQYIDLLRKVAREDGERFLADARSAALELASDLEVFARQQVGGPVEILGRASASATMVAVGATGRSGLAELLVGSTALELPPRSHAPVVIVRPRADGTTADSGPVVVGVAGSIMDDPAVEFAFEQASLLGVELVAVHTWSDSPLPDLDRMTGLRDDWDAIFERERRLLAERLAGYAERYPDVMVESVVTFDGPARALLTQAHSAQLLVVGTRGRGILAGAMLGSTSRAAIKLSVCPVAVVRHYA
jgi:nucleotide-binding universal stress UspA family protein